MLSTRVHCTVLAEDIGPGDRNFSNLREEQRKSTKASRQTCTVRKPRQNLCSSSSKDRRSGCCGAAKIAVAARTLNSVDLTRRTTGWNLTGFFLPSFADGATFIRERGIPGACSVHRTVPLIRTLLGKGGDTYNHREHRERRCMCPFRISIGNNPKTLSSQLTGD
jgi:hypothetical protein